MCYPESSLFDSAKVGRMEHLYKLIQRNAIF